MSNDKKDPEIQEQDFLGGVKVVDIGDIRVARGLSRRAYSSCRHAQLVYDKTERRVWCKDCERDVEPFDAFESVVGQFYHAKRHYEALQRQVEEAQAHSMHLIACKNLESVWRGNKMAPACPHCREALLPEDFKTLGLRVSAELARQKRIAKKGRHE